jgi:cell division septal protein FtsQ
MPDYKRLVRGKKSFIRRIDRGRRLPKKLIAVLIFSGLVFLFLFLGLRSLLLNSPHLRVKELSVIYDDGTPVASPQDFFQLDSNSTDNLFSFDMREVVQDIQARHPELIDVLVRKEFPHRLLIIIKEREPVAMIVLQDLFLSDLSSGTYSVDREGFIVPFKPADKNLPRVIGVGSQQLQLYAKSPSLRLKSVLTLLKELEETDIYPEYKILQVDVRDYSNITFYLEDKIKVKMGQGAFKKKAGFLSEILAQHKASGMAPPEYIDMRFDNPVVKP